LKLLSVENFSLWLKSNDGRVLPVLEDISLAVDSGKCLGIAGESGSGKSILALSILQLVPPGIAAKSSGSIFFRENNLGKMSESQIRNIRGNHIAMVFQEPMTALNPLMTLYEQIAETVRAHAPNKPEAEVENLVKKALAGAGFPEPAKFYDSFPHQLSGGMRQRAMLAIALVMEPDLIIADEPTTALDAVLQVQLLHELRTSIKQKSQSLIFISHDLGVIRAIADDLVIMYAGQVMETGETKAVLESPRHPYTNALVGAMPRLIFERKLPKPIPGHLPSPDKKPGGCVFSDRCPKSTEKCKNEVPALKELDERRKVKCFFP